MDLILVAGKAGCKLCVAAKQKLALLGLEHRFVDLEQFPQDWRELDLSGAMALYALHDRLPWLRIEGEWMEYPRAMATIRKAMAVKQVAVPELVA